MPFIKPDRRVPLQTGDAVPREVGELCFLRYKEIMDEWRRNPRWTTIHNMFVKLTGAEDEEAAAFLAFLEFYLNHGHNYELTKKEQHGDI